MKNKLMLVILLALHVLVVSANIPLNYYGDVDAKRGDAILDALFQRIQNHTVISYNDLERYYQNTDWRTNDMIWDMYSTCTFTMADANKPQRAVCDGWNKEHTVPQSWFSKQSPMKSDLFHVYPTDARVNNFRSNHPYGETSGAAGKGITNNAGNHALGKVGNSNFSGYTGVVYEPDDEYKGDLARTYFYMVARYRNRSLNASEGAEVFTSYPTNLTGYAIALFLKWNRQDPVSAKEIERNEAVYAIQHNRNPFIDYPYLAEYIWGDKKGYAVDFSQILSSSDPGFVPGVSDGQSSSTEPMLISRVAEITFTTLKEGESSQQTLELQGYRLTHNVNLTISGDDAANFVVSPASIPLAAIKENGKQSFTVTYAPKTTAIHTATLTITSEGAVSKNIALSGSCATEAQIVWIANCNVYTEGNPTISAAIGGKIGVLPTVPKSCSETSSQFVGWTQMPINGTVDEMPSDLFSDISEAPLVDGNMKFYAVFARLTESEGTTSEEITWTYENHNGWIDDLNPRGTSAYETFDEGKSLTSPEIDLSKLKSIVCNMRTYGGKNNGTIDIYAGKIKLGSLATKEKALKDITWTNNETLKGKSRLVFSSKTTTSNGGPAAASVKIYLEGTTYTYDRYLTSCGGSCEMGVENISNNYDVNNVKKLLIEGKLFIEIDGHMYNMMGQIVK